MSNRWYGLVFGFGLFTLCATVLYAQPVRVVYPVKQDHLWGFMSRRGKMLIPPRYDAIGDRATLIVPVKDGISPEYRLVEVNGKLGVINHHLEEVLSCSYDYILPVSASQFLVRRAEGYTVIDTSDQSLSGTYYDHLEFAGASGDGSCLYRFKQDKKLGLLSAQGDTLLPGQYTQIQLLEWFPDLFLTRLSPRALTWTLTAAGGKVVLSDILEARGPHPGLLLIRKRGEKSTYLTAINKEAAPFPALDSLRFSSGKYLTPDLVLLNQDELNDRTGKTKRTQHLFNVREGKLIKDNSYVGFEYLDGQYCLATAWRPAPVGNIKLTTILNTQGKLLPTAGWYRSIAPWPGALQKYRVFDRYGYGIVDRNGTLLVAAEYHEIGPVEDGLATVQLNNRLGMITAEGRTIVPAECTRIRRRKDKLTLEKNESTTILYLDDSLNVRSLQEYQRMKTLNVGAPPTTLRMAERAAWEQLFTQSGSSADNNPTVSRNLPDSVRLARWFCLDEPGIQLATDLFPLPVADSLGLSHDFLRRHRKFRVSPNGFLRFYSNGESIELSSFRHLSQRKICVVPQRLFFEQGAALYPEPVAGLRGSDFTEGSPLAAALTPDGRFFLLDQNGAPLYDADGNTMYFSFVGNWNEGLLRVCIGGKLTEEEDNEGSRETLPSYRRMLMSFSPTLPCNVPKEGGAPLVMRSPTENEARWGVIDTNGRWVVPPTYEYIAENVGGQMVARQDNRYGVIDQTEQVIVPFDYLAIRPYHSYWRVNSLPIGDLYFNWRGHQIMDADTEEARLFREGACARRVNGYWHYINENGKRIGQDSFLTAKSFGEGLAAVRIDSTQWAFVDTSGSIRHQLPSGRYHNLGHFVEGRCWFRRGAAFGFLDTDMKEVVAAQYREVEDFDRGRAIVSSHTGIAIIDTTGKVLIPAGQYAALSAWNDQNLAVATVAGQGQFLVDSLGLPLHQKAYDLILLKGEAPYAAKRGYYWGFINAQGQEVISPRFREVQAFQEGRAAVKPTRGGDLWQFINPQGQAISPERFDDVNTSFTNGLALVKNRNTPPFLLDSKGNKPEFPISQILFMDGTLIGCQEEGKAFFTDHRGNRVFSRTFDEVEPFGEAETTSVVMERRKGIVDRRGMLLVECKYYKFEPRPDDTYLVGPPAFGIYDREGKLVVPAEYDHLLLLEGNLFRVERGEKVGYLKTDGEFVWKLQN